MAKFLYLLINEPPRHDSAAPKHIINMTAKTLSDLKQFSLVDGVVFLILYDIFVTVDPCSKNMLSITLLSLSLPDTFQIFI